MWLSVPTTADEDAVNADSEFFWDDLSHHEVPVASGTGNIKAQQARD